MIVVWGWTAASWPFTRLHNSGPQWLAHIHLQHITCHPGSKIWFLHHEWRPLYQQWQLVDHRLVEHRGHIKFGSAQNLPRILLHFLFTHIFHSITLSTKLSKKTHLNSQQKSNILSTRLSYIHFDGDWMALHKRIFIYGARVFTL